MSLEITKNQRMDGFSLIELMIVVAIVGILSAVAIPAYNNYVQKAQISEGFSEVGGMQLAISTFAQEYGSYPQAADISAGIGGTIVGKYSTATTIAGTGVIIVSMNSSAGVDVANQSITFTPPAYVVGATSFPFVCTSTVKQKYLPKNCLGA